MTIAFFHQNGIRSPARVSAWLGNRQTSLRTRQRFHWLCSRAKRWVC